MEVGGRIRELRAAHGMSQDGLAARVYVSRQTISSWENGKTYPDVQSLLLLSEIFGASVDFLIKGDVETMTETIEKDAVVIRRLGAAMIALAACTVVAALWAIAQVEIWGWKGVQVVPTLLLTLALWGCLMFCSHWAERIKREHDLVTYREVLDFWNGVEPDRDTERGRRERAIPGWMRAVRAGGMIVLAAAVGFLCARYGIELLRAIFG